MEFLWSHCPDAQASLLTLIVLYPRGRKGLTVPFFTVSTSPLRGTCSGLEKKSFSKTSTQTWISKFHHKSKANFSSLSFIVRSSTSILPLHAGYSASQLEVFHFISIQWYRTKKLPLFVASSDLQLAGAIQTSFMWHWGFSVLKFPHLHSVGHQWFYELIPVLHFSAVTHKQSASLFTPRTPFAFGNLLSCKSEGYFGSVSQWPGRTGVYNYFLSKYRPKAAVRNMSYFCAQFII